MSYNSSIEYLYGLRKYGMKFGLDNIRRLTSALGNPQKSYRSIHVAGTNGKGSISAMIESILRTGGINTGLFTSPHLVSFTERIRINGVEIDEADVIELSEEVRSIAESMEDFHPTFFEVVTAMAFLHFKKMKVDWAVVEVGMGGRLDATNILMPEVSVIANIDYDHCEFLGRTLKEISAEKAGIIKDSVPVITAEQKLEAMEVIEKKATETRSSVYKYNSEFSSGILSENPDEICFNYYGIREYSGIRLPLSGAHQVINASIAAKTVEIISDKYPIMSCDINRGIENTSWQGRLEIIKDAPPVLIDGAHNPSAACALSKYLERILGSKYRRIIMIVGTMNDKDINGILQPILPLSSEIIFASPAYERAASPDTLAALSSTMGFHSRKALSVNDALNMAEDIYMPGDLIVVTGSFYTAGEAKEALVKKGVLAKLRE